jgi:hypothetical protein
LQIYAKFLDDVKKCLHLIAIFAKIFAINYAKGRKTTLNT